MVAAPQLIDNRYLLQGVIGRGGMGVVYQALDRLHQRVVALKQVSAEASSMWLNDSTTKGQDFRMALAQEFKLSASLRHPNIIAVLDYGFGDDQQPYYTMELLPEPQTILEAARHVSSHERVGLLIQMLYALAYLHRRGIVHRDLKPANVLVTDHRVKVLDFGLSTMHQQRDPQSPEHGATVGTLAYMAPEVLTGMSLTFASDLYAVGMMGYEMLTDQHPFDVADTSMLVNDILMKQPDFSTFEADPQVKQVIQRLLQKDPQDRYSKASDVVDALLKVSDVAHSRETSAIRESFLQAATLVGRDAEFSILSEALKQTLNGKGSGWLIAGESGVGKTRLLDELRTQALVQGAVVMRGQAVSIGSQPYQLWHAVLRWLALLSPELVEADRLVLQQVIPDIHDIMGDAPVDETFHLSAQQLQPELLRILTQVLGASPRPAVILIEDLHWAGTESIALLQRFSEYIRDLPVLLLTSYRNDEAPQLHEGFEHLQLMHLQRLDGASIEALSQAMLGDAGGAPDVVELLQRETEGNVFFLVEVVRALAEEVGQLEQIGRVTLPARVFAGGVHAVVQRRLERLDDESRTLLEKSAIMGRELDVAVLQRLSGNIALEDWLAMCVNAAVLSVVGAEWSFAHDKIRLSLTEALLPAERRPLHQAVAEAIQAQYDDDTTKVALLAYHFGQAGDRPQEERYVTYAGEQSLRTGAYQEAIAYFQRAEALLPQLELSEQRTQRKQVHLHQRKGEAYLGRGDYEQARTSFAESLELMRLLGDKVGIAVSMGHLANALLVLGQFDEAQTTLEAALSLYRGAGNDAGVARTLNQLGDLAYERGDQAAANAHYRDSLRLSREIGQEWGMAGALTTRTMTVIDAKVEFTKTREHLEQRLQAAFAAGDRQAVANTLYNLGVQAHQQGELGAAAEFLRQALVYQRALGDVVGMAQTREQLGDLAMTSQAIEQEFRNYQAALQAASDAGEMPKILNTLLAIAQLDMKRGSLAAALEVLAFLLHHPESTDTIHTAAENLVFELERLLPSDDIARGWERGKRLTFDELLDWLLER